jgi:hypothetical protein
MRAPLSSHATINGIIISDQQVVMAYMEYFGKGHFLTLSHLFKSRFQSLQSLLMQSLQYC